VANFDDIKKKASLPVRVVPLCLAGELVEEHAQLERQLAELKPATSLEGSGKQTILEALDAVRERMVDATVDFHLKALPARPWALFYSGMPARKEAESDEEWEPRIFAWQADMVSRVCVDPAMTADQVGELVDIIHARSWSVLANAAFMVNMGGIDIPNSVAVSDLTPGTEQT
jgi:hypothetical protein